MAGCLQKVHCGNGNRQAMSGTSAALTTCVLNRSNDQQQAQRRLDEAWPEPEWSRPDVLLSPRVALSFCTLQCYSGLVVFSLMIVWVKGLNCRRGLCLTHRVLFSVFMATERGFSLLTMPCEKRMIAQRNHIRFIINGRFPRSSYVNFPIRQI